MPTTYQYSDVVSDAGTGRPVSNASVVLKLYPSGDLAVMYDVSGNVVTEVRTGSTGRFVVYAEAGHYSLFVNGVLQLNDIALSGGGTIAEDGTNVQAYGGLASAIASSSTAGKTLHVTTPQSVNADLNTNGREIVIHSGGVITIAAGKTLTFTVQPQIGVYQAFAGAGAVSGLNESRPEWFGTGAAAFNAAVDALILGGRVLLQPTTYRSPYDTDATKLRKGYVSFVGARMPSVNSGATALENGTIIQGTFNVFAHHVSIRDLGVDSGAAVCTSYYSGNGQNAFVIGTDGTSPPPWKGLRAENITCLCKDKATAFHAFLCENVDGAYCSNIHTKFGTHGIVFKALRTTAQGLYAEDHVSDGLIIKADDYAACSQLDISNVVVTASSSGNGGGIMLLGNSAHLTHINMTNVTVTLTSYGIKFNGNGVYLAQDINLTDVTVASTTGIGYYFNGATSFCTVDNGTANSNSGTGFVVDAGAVRINFVSCKARVNAGNGFSLSGTLGHMLNCTASANSGYGIYLTGSQQVDSCNIPIDNTAGPVGFGTGGRIVSANASAAITAPTLLNSWANFGSGNPTAGWWVDQGRLRLCGLVTGGTVAQPMFTLPVGYRPAGGKRFMVPCFNGTTVVAGELGIASNGNVTLNYGTNNYVSLDGIEFSLALD